MIRSFGDDLAEALFNGQRTNKTRRFSQQLQDRSHRRLILLDSAAKVEDLRFPQSNRLERLSGDLKDYWSIRINDQWRILFRWNEGDEAPWDVKIDDYH